MLVLDWSKESEDILGTKSIEVSIEKENMWGLNQGKCFCYWSAFSEVVGIVDDLEVFVGCKVMELSGGLVCGGVIDDDELSKLFAKEGEEDCDGLWKRMLFVVGGDDAGKSGHR